MRHLSVVAVALFVWTTQRSLPFDIPAGVDLHLPVPQDNPLTPASVALGQRLFADPILSRDGKMRCATCHDPGRAFTDGRRFSAGVAGAVPRRHTPTLVNAAYRQTFFWDGREATLERQVLGPIADPSELGLGLAMAQERLSRDPSYVRAFREAFGQPPNPGNLGRALGAYVRSILSGNAPVDRYLAGEGAALSPAARDGLSVFRGRGRCSRCHLGPDFTDDRFHNTGVAWRNGPPSDLGRFEVTGRQTDRGAFKTPTLREVGRTAPYMHDGSLASLEDVVDFYNRGAEANPFLDSDVRPLNLTAAERSAIIAFLHALTGTVQHGAPPARD